MSEVVCEVDYSDRLLTERKNFASVQSFGKANRPGQHQRQASFTGRARSATATDCRHRCLSRHAEAYEVMTSCVWEVTRWGLIHQEQHLGGVSSLQLTDMINSQSGSTSGLLFIYLAYYYHREVVIWCLLFARGATESTRV